MSEFVVNDDMFGRYCEIATDFSRSLHIYKIVGLIESNCYCDMPLTNQSEPIWHKNIVPVLLVIHCGIDETRVQRVALSDCKVHSIANNAETKHGQWKINEYKNHLNVVCSNCNKEFYVYKQGQYHIDRSNYCPNCGAKMDGERKDEE